MKIETRKCSNKTNKTTKHQGILNILKKKDKNTFHGNSKTIPNVTQTSTKTYHICKTVINNETRYLFVL